MNNSQLSVTLTCYNHAQFVGEALDAILAQDYLPLEIIVIDDGSTDSSFDIIQSFAEKNPHIQAKRLPDNTGARAARKHAIEMSRGAYLYNAAADDKILPGFFQKSMHLLNSYPQAGLCSTLSFQMNAHGKKKRLFPTPIITSSSTYLSPEVVEKKLVRNGAWFMGNTAIYRRQATENVGGYDPQLGAFGDGYLQHVIALKFGVCFVPEPLACWRRVSSGVSATLSRNVERMHEVMERTEWYMKSQESPHHGLFPLQYAKQWKKRQIYWMNQALNVELNQHEEVFMEKTRELTEPQILFDKAYVISLRTLLFLRRFLVTLFSQLRCATWPATLLMIRWWIQSLKYWFIAK